MAEATWIIDRETGELTVEGLTAREAAGLTVDLLGGVQPVNCGRPAGVPPLHTSKVQGEPLEPTLRVYRVRFPQRTLRVWTYELPDGKLEQYQVAPAG